MTRTSFETYTALENPKEIDFGKLRFILLSFSLAVSYSYPFSVLCNISAYCPQMLEAEGSTSTPYEIPCLQPLADDYQMSSQLPPASQR